MGSHIVNFTVQWANRALKPNPRSLRIKDFLKLLKLERWNINVIDVIFVRKNDTIRKIALNIRHGLKRKVHLKVVCTFKSNLIDIPNNTWCLDSGVLFMYLMWCKDSSRSKWQDKVRIIYTWETIWRLKLKA